MENWKPIKRFNSAFLSVLNRIKQYEKLSATEIVNDYKEIKLLNDINCLFIFIGATDELSKFKREQLKDLMFVNQLNPDLDFQRLNEINRSDDNAVRY